MRSSLAAFSSDLSPDVVRSFSHQSPLESQSQERLREETPIFLYFTANFVMSQSRLLIGEVFGVFRFLISTHKSSSRAPGMFVVSLNLAACGSPPSFGSGY